MKVMVISKASAASEAGEMDPEMFAAMDKFIEELRFIRRKRAPGLKRVDTLIPIEVASKLFKPGGQHVHQSVVSRVRHPGL